MRALRIPYPYREPLAKLPEAMKVDFPDRHLSYVIFGCETPDLERCSFEVRKTVESHRPGTEPPALEIRFTDSN